MKIAIFGGSFDPIHRGHISLAENVRVLAGIDKIVFVPVGKPSHKIRISAAKADRLKMLKLALKHRDFFSIDKYEFSRSEPSYSYRTISYFKKRYPEDEILFLTGSDSLSSLSEWKKGWGILHLCRFIVGRRKAGKRIKIPLNLKDRVIYARTPFVLVSSSRIREMVRRNKSIKGMVPESVRAYIVKKKLYKKGIKV